MTIKKTYVNWATVVLAASVGTASGDGLADDFNRPNMTGVKTDHLFFPNQPGYLDQDPGNAGDKEGFPVERPGGAIRVDVQTGYDSNPWEWDNPYDVSAWVYNIMLRGANLWNTPQSSVYVAGGVKYAFYDFDDATPNREGSDDHTLDLTGRMGLTYNFAENRRLTFWNELEYGGTGKYNSGFVRAGIQEQDIARISSTLRYDYRGDGQVLGSNGFEHSTGVNYLGYYGQEWSNWDFSRIGIRQNFTKVVHPDLRVGLVGGWACNFYDDDMFDSESYDLGLTAGGRVGPGLDYQLETGFQRRTYDYDSRYDRTTFYFSGVLNGEVANNTFLTTKLSYGIEDNYNNFGASFTEATGFRAEARLTRDLGDLTVRGQLGAGWLEGDLLMGPSDDITRYTAGVAVDKDWHDYKLSASLEYTWGDRDFGGGADFDYDRTQVMFTLGRSF